jgi:hypothetical protein
MKIRTQELTSDSFVFVVENDDGSTSAYSPRFASRKDVRAAARKLAKDYSDAGVEVEVEASDAD